MNSSSAPNAAVPATEFERFLATLSEPLRDECKTRLSGSGLSPNHPVFTVLADFFEKNFSKPPAPDFYEEALLHSNSAKQLLADFRDLPTAILARIETQMRDVLASLSASVERLERASADLDRNVEALPILLLPKRARTTPAPAGFWNKIKWRIGTMRETKRTIFADRFAWFVAGVTCFCGAAILATSVLSFGASHLSSYYEELYRQRLSHLEADSLENTIALNRLLAAGISLKVERENDGTSYYLILRGAHKAAPPVNSPEGLAVEVWP